jgi:rhamnosyltransferase
MVYFGIPIKRYLTRVKYVNSLISSGSLVRLKAFQHVGGFKENYFIDCTDADWYFRAKQLNYIFAGVPNAVMEHSIGDGFIKIWLFRVRYIAIHNPLRNYYSYRNTILMLKENKFSVPWKLFYFFKLCIQFPLFLLLLPNRYQRFKLICIGIYHGFKNQSGEFNFKGFC